MNHSFYILGSGRSGTSMLAGLFSKMNIYYGENLHEKRESNPKGFFESPRINQLNAKILLPYSDSKPATKSEHTWLSKIEDYNNLATSNNTLFEIDQHLSNDFFCYKDTRYCYTLPIWTSRKQNPFKIVAVYRKPEIVIQSTIKEILTQPYLKDYQFSIQKLVSLWCSQNKRILHYCDKYKSKIHLVSYESILTEKAKSSLESFVGLNLNWDFPTKDLDRSQATSPLFSNEVNDIYRALSETEHEYLTRYE